MLANEEYFTIADFMPEDYEEPVKMTRPFVEIQPLGVSTLTSDVNIEGSWVAPKRDGVRVITFTEDERLYLDHDGEVLEIGQGGDGNNVWDCELVADKLYILDVLVYNGVNVSNQNFLHRLNLLNQSWFYTSVYNVEIQTYTLFNREKPVRSDEGTIFVTNVRSNSQFFKYKKTFTVDFRVAEKEGKFFLTTADGFSVQQVNKHSIDVGIIYECKLLDGIWIPMRRREDKTKPNSTSTYTRTLRAIHSKYDPYAPKASVTTPVVLSCIKEDPRNDVIEKALSKADGLTFNWLIKETEVPRSCVENIIKRSPFFKASSDKIVHPVGVSRDDAIFAYVSTISDYEGCVQAFSRIAAIPIDNARIKVDRMLDPTGTTSSAHTTLLTLFMRYDVPILPYSTICRSLALSIEDLKKRYENTRSVEFKNGAVHLVSGMKALDSLKSTRSHLEIISDVIGQFPCFPGEAVYLISQIQPNKFVQKTSEFSRVCDVISNTPSTCLDISFRARVEVQVASVVLTSLVLSKLVDKESSHKGKLYSLSQKKEFSYVDVIEDIFISETIVSRTLGEVGHEFKKRGYFLPPYKIQDLCEDYCVDNYYVGKSSDIDEVKAKIAQFLNGQPTSAVHLVARFKGIFPLTQIMESIRERPHSVVDGNVIYS